MALINYRPNEGLTARMTGVVSVLAIMLLGFYQLFYFLSGILGTTVGAEQQLLTVPMLTEIAERRADIEAELDQDFLNISRRQYSMATGQEEAMQEQLNLYDDARIGELQKEVVRPLFRTSQALLERDTRGRGPTALTQQDITDILASKEKPETVGVLGEPGLQLISELREKVGKELVPTGTALPLDANLDLALTTPLKFSVLVVQASELLGIIGGLEADKVELIDGLEKVEEGGVEKVPAFAAGAKLSELRPGLAKYPPTQLLKLRSTEEGGTLTAALNRVADGSVLGAPIFEPTLIKLAETVVVNATEILPRGSELSADALTKLEAVGRERLLVRVETVRLLPAQAVGYTPAAPIPATLEPGTVLTTELLVLVQESRDAEGKVKVANSRQLLMADGDEADVRARLTGKVLSARKVMPEQIVLAAAPENAADATMTLEDYWVSLMEFNKAQEEQWEQSIGSRDLLTRAAGEPETFTIYGKPTAPATTPKQTLPADLTNLLLAEAIVSAGVEVLPRGEVTDLLDANLLITGVGAGNSFKAWRIETLTASVLEQRSAQGPEFQHELAEAFVNEGGDELLPKGTKFTSDELLAHQRIDDIRAASTAGKLFKVVNDAGGSTPRTLAYFEQDSARWEQILVLEEPIQVEVPRTIVEVGATLDDAAIDRILALPEDQRSVIVRGDCSEQTIGELTAEIFEVCEEPLAVTVPDTKALTAGVAKVLEGAEAAEILLKGGNRSESLERIQSLLEGGVTVVSLESVTEGGEEVAAADTVLSMDLLDEAEAKGLSELNVSGTRVERRLEDLRPGAVPADAEGITVVQPLKVGEDALGKNAELTADVLLELGERRKDAKIHFPFAIHSGDDANPQSLRITSDADWGKLQSALPVSYTLDQGIDLRGPLARPIARIGTNYSVTWAGLIVLGLVLVFLLALSRLANHKKLSDLLVETESEMRKVSWPTKEDLIGSSQVVVIAVVALAVFMLTADWVMDGIISFILIE